MTRLADLIADQVARTPMAIAVRDGRTDKTYAQLWQDAQAVAERLRRLGAEPDRIVAICAERSAELTTALVGVLAAGAAYLPLDPADPLARLNHMLTEARPIAVLADDAFHERLRAAGAETVCALDATGGPPDAIGGRPPAESDSDLAYVIYTSGSTGQPKGVAIEHAGVVNRLRWMQERYLLTDTDAVLQKTPYTFDVSVWEFFWPLIAGARLVMARPGGHRDPEYLAQTIIDENITTVHFVPSMLGPFLSDPAAARCTSLRRIFSSGEALTSALANRCTGLIPAELHNLYGPTEASIDAAAWQCRTPEPGATVPIGYPISGVQASIVDGRGHAGEVGELLLSGVCLARGYLGRPDVTAAHFVTDPLGSGKRVYRTGDLVRRQPDGCLEFLGRIDHQVKLRGLRIELGEIEAVLLQHDGLMQAAVVLRDDVGPAARLAAYVVARPELDVAVSTLHEYLGARLPEYMLPSYIVMLAALPINRSGKCDRSALPVPSRADLAAVTKRST